MCQSHRTTRLSTSLLLACAVTAITCFSSVQQHVVVLEFCCLIINLLIKHNDIDLIVWFKIGYKSFMKLFIVFWLADIWTVIVTIICCSIIRCSKVCYLMLFDIKFIFNIEYFVGQIIQEI